MCSIVGIIGEKSNEKRLDAMLSSQAHRGPDDTGKYIDDGVVLGHNRLSTIDLSSDANQPFVSQDGRYKLVYSGEIYNYLELKSELASHYNFKTKSDTEVLLAAYIIWGANCLHRFSGMFSFTIWDTKKKTLFAARDRFGVKPLYYVSADNGFSFASEIKTLFASGIKKETNDTVWVSYFVYGSYGMPNETFWRGVEQRPRGHYLTLENKQVTIKKRCDFEESIKKHENELPFEEVLATYETLLEDSINLRFRADVPVGFNLSGGLDSSTLLAFVNTTQEKKGINAYTFYTNDELRWVEEMIASTQNPLHKVLLDVNEVEHLGKKLSAVQDEPYGGVSTIAYGNIFKTARRQEVKELLDGQGMDEQWAGYDYYTKPSDSTIQGIRKSPFRASVSDKGFLALAQKPMYSKPFKDNVKNLQYRNLFYTKIPRALRFNDRVSMAASTELREPFLDHRMVELAFAQPLKYKIQNGSQKYLLRILVDKYLSDSIRFAPKRPLQTPQREWLGDDLKQWVKTEVAYLGSCDWFNPNELQKELDIYFNGDQESSFHIWQWLNTSLLLKNL